MNASESSGTSEAGDTMVPCEGGPIRPVGWIRVPVPLPLEVDRGDDGVYVLDERADGAVYVYVT